MLVTESGYESLTHYPTDLDSVIVRGAKPVHRLVGALTRRAVGI